MASSMPAGGVRAGAGLAILLMITANVLFACNDVWMRRLADQTSLGMVMWARSTLFLCGVLICRSPAAWRAALATSTPGMQIGRGLAPITASFLLVGAMGVLPIADVSAVFFLSPLITAGLAVLLLGERVSAWLWVALVVGLGGVLLVVQPGSSTLGIGHILAILGGAAVACYQILTRIVAQRSDALTTLFYMALAATVVTSLALPWTWRTAPPEVWLQLAGTAVVYGTAHTMYIGALARAQSSHLAPFVYAQLVGAIGAGWVVYGQVPSPTTLAGAAVIVSAGLIALRRPVMPTVPTPAAATPARKP